MLAGMQQSAVTQHLRAHFDQVDSVPCPQREWAQEFKDKKKVVEWPGHCFESFVIVVRCGSCLQLWHV